MAGQSEVRQACRIDPWYFATGFVKTRDPQADNPIRRFPKYGFLKGLFHNCVNHLMLSVPKSRQMLITWGVLIYIFWCCGFHDHRHWICQSEKEEKAKALKRRLDFVGYHLPANLLGVTSESKTNKIVFSNGSLIDFVPQGPTQIASYNPSGVFMDEMGLQEYAQDAYETLVPAMRSGGQLIGVSTPRGHNFFHKYVTEIPAVHEYRVYYKVHPEYQAQAKALGGWDAWREKVQKEWGFSDDAAWDREMEINFDVSGGLPAFKPPFDTDTHVASGHLSANPAVKIQRGWDLGFHHPACVWTQVAANGQWLILRELLGKDILLADFVSEVRRVSKELAPWSTPDTFQDYVDPSAYHLRDAGPSSMELLWEKKIFPINDSTKFSVIDTVRLVKQNLRLGQFPNAQGVNEIRPMTLVDPRCPLLIRALNGGYAASKEDSEKFVGGLLVHLVDALRYTAACTFTLGDLRVKKGRHYAA